MEILSQVHKTFLLELLNTDVSFMLIGGYAVNYHGYARYTMDMDIWLKPDNENKERLLKFLESKGFEQKGIAHLNQLDFSEEQAFYIGKEEGRIDFLTKIAGVAFEEADKEKVFLPLGDKEIPVIHYNHLIANKKRSARPKDLGDVDELEQIKKKRD